MNPGKISRRVRGRVRIATLTTIASVAALSVTERAIGARSWNTDPFQTPGRSYGSAPGDLSIEEVNAMLEPCLIQARESFRAAASRFAAGLPPESRFFVVTRVTEPVFKQFYVEVESVNGETIQGRVESEFYDGDTFFSRGDSYELAVNDIVDWLIVYPDRPEEGNLLGKYIIRLDDGLISGPCDAESDVLRRFRVYQPGYSFIPPDADGWQLHGGTADADVTIQKIDSTSDTLDTVFSSRSRVRARVSKMTLEQFADYILRTEKDNLGDPDRYTLLEHEVEPHTGRPESCVSSRQIIEDREALLPSGERTPMIREIWELICLHPGNERTAVLLSFVHRYPVGQRDPEFPGKAQQVLDSLTFSEFDRL